MKRMSRNGAEWCQSASSQKIFAKVLPKWCNVQSALRFHHLFLKRGVVFIFADKFFHHKLTLGWKQSSLKMRTKKKNKNDEDDEDPLHHLPRKNWEKECALKCANISRTGFFVNAQGMKIRWYAWDASGNDGHGKKSSSGKDAKKNDGRRRATLEEKDEEKDQEEIGVVVGAHGSGAHAMFEWLQSIPMGTARNKYKNSWIERMNKKGLTFYAYDHQGAGRSECARGCKAFMERESDLVEDNARFMKLVRERHCGGNTNDDENTRGVEEGVEIETGVAATTAVERKCSRRAFRWAGSSSRERLSSIRSYSPTVSSYCVQCSR